jgi:uncharacterized delta-60 repeat protein/uncharacterized repeat protein (TIGR01451 family)
MALYEARSPRIRSIPCIDTHTQPDGKIIALGDAWHGPAATDFAAVRLTAEGTFDPTFGEDGKLLFDLGTDHDFARINDAALLSDGTIVAAGSARIRNSAGFGGLQVDVAILRLLPNGALDATFGDGGAVFSNLAGAEYLTGGVAVMNDGQIVVGGHTDHQRNAFVTRFNADGSLDHEFGTSGPGFSITNVSGDATTVAFAAQPNGDVLVAGHALGRALVLRYLGESRGVEAAVNEGSQATVTGTFGDAGDDIVAITASSGAISQTGTQSGTWSWSLTPTDGPEQTQSVKVTATDSDGAQSSVTFDLRVNDVAPTIALAGPAAVNKGAPYVLNLGEIVDPSADDIVSYYAIRWGDGQETGSIPIADFAPQAQTVFAVPGAYTIHVDFFDDDGWHRDAGVLDVWVRDAGPNLKVKQTVKPKSARPGKTVTFRINVANIGNWQASGVFLTFQLPAGLKRIAAGSTPGWTAAGKQRFRFNLGTLAAGQSKTVTFKARLAAALRPGSVLTARVSAVLDGLEGPDANLADNLQKVKIRVLGL